jgi:hypothetical protein
MIMIRHRTTKTIFIIHISSLAFLLLIAATGIHAQTPYAIEDEDTPVTTADQKLTEIKNTLEKSIKTSVTTGFNDKMDNRAKVKVINDGGSIYKIAFTVARKTAAQLVCTLSIRRDNQNDGEFSGEMYFSFDQLESLIGFLKNDLIKTDMITESGINKEWIQNKIDQMQLSMDDNVTITVKITPAIFPKNDELSTSWNSLPLSMKVDGYKIEETYSNTGGVNYSLDPYNYDTGTDTFNGDFSSISPEISEYLESLKPQIMVFDRKTGAWKAKEIIRAGESDDDMYKVRYACTSKIDTGANNYTFTLAPPVEKTYTVKRLPLYDFSAASIVTTEYNFGVTFKDSDYIIYNVGVFGLSGIARGMPNSYPSHYIYINADMARYINAHNGNLQFVLSDHFDYNIDQVAIIKNEYRPMVRIVLELQKEEPDNEENNENFLKQYDNMVQHYKVIANIKKENDNIILDHLPEEINTETADWFIKISFANEIEPDAGAVLSFKDITVRDSLAGSKTLEDIGKALVTHFYKTKRKQDTSNPAQFLDMAKVMTFLGKTKERDQYLEAFEKELSPSAKRNYEPIISGLRNWTSASLGSNVLLQVQEKQKKAVLEDLFWVTPQKNIAKDLQSISDIVPGISEEEKERFLKTFGL